MDDSEESTGRSPKISSGPLRVYEWEGELFVAGFGLWIPVESEQEGRDLIAELEDQGYRLCH